MPDSRITPFYGAGMKLPPDPGRPTAWGYFLAALLISSVTSPSTAQEVEQPDPVQEVPGTRDGAPSANTEDGVGAGRGRVFEPAYFERYAPRNALDMVEQIPGFSISGGGGGRGLGQASQNVLVNGERLSSKSESASDQLQRIPAGDVVRIEIVNGTTLDIPGLTGDVANVVVESSGASGQFRYTAGFRLHNTEAQLFGGEASLSGTSGNLDYTVAISNENNRFGADGLTRITDATDALIELQETQFSGGFDNPTLATNFTWRPASGLIANLNLSYGEDFFFRDSPETGVPIEGPRRFRTVSEREDGPEYEIGGDVEFGLGPGRLKLIGLERFERDNYESELVDQFDDGFEPQGDRFERISEAGERIGRFEYGWPMWSADWQLSGEAAFNRLNRDAALFVLEDEVFVPIAFPGGSGEVTEDRYEGSLSYSRQVTPGLGVQLVAGAEYSKLEQTGSLANARAFIRPKGSASLAWNPSDDFNASLELEREVGQLSFGAFLASVELDEENENEGNNQLVPFQAWDLTLELNKTFAPWGSAQLELRRTWFEDFVDFFPLPGGGEARGNIGGATRFQAELNATVKFDPIGWTGAQLQIEGEREWSDVVDPFTGLGRPFSSSGIDELELDFRQDIFGTDWAYGSGLFTFDPAPYSRLFETGRGYEGPVFLDVFVENKDVFGLTARVTAGNILGARNFFTRTVFAGPRPDAEILFIEDRDQRIGPTFRFSLSGNF